MGMIFTGQTEAEALETAAEALGVDKGEIAYDVLERRSGVLGFGSKFVKLEVNLQRGSKSSWAKHVVEKLIAYIGVEATAAVSRDDDELIELDLTSNDDNLIIGKSGVVLDALQYLVNKIVNRDPDNRKLVVLESGGYRKRKEESLRRLAERMADKARKTGDTVRLTRLSPRDRRIVHLTISEMDDVCSASEGDGRNRTLLIIPD